MLIAGGGAPDQPLNAGSFDFSLNAPLPDSGNMWIGSAPYTRISFVYHMNRK